MRETQIQRIKYAPPPPELPIYGRIDPKEVSFIGRTNYVAALEEKKFVFGIKRTDRERHAYVLGKSGMGKSKLLELLIRQDIADGYGLCVFDSSGDLINPILDFIPQNRINDVIVIDPTLPDFEITINLISKKSPQFKHRFAENLIEIFENLFGLNWNSNLEHLCRFICLALLDYPDAALNDFIHILKNKDRRENIISHVTDEITRSFWTEEFTQWSEKYGKETIMPFITKLNQIISDPLMRKIFNQSETKINFEKIIEEKKIVIVNLARQKIGESNSIFFGSLLAAKIYEAGLIKETNSVSKQSQKFYIYLDGCHNIVGKTLENLLQEAHKYGFCLTLSHQHLQQLKPQTHTAILNSVGTIIIFRLSGEDAIRLKPEMAPVFDVKDMINLGVQQFYIKMTISGEIYDPFSAETLKIKKPGAPVV